MIPLFPPLTLEIRFLVAFALRFWTQTGILHASSYCGCRIITLSAVLRSRWPSPQLTTKRAGLSLDVSPVPTTIPCRGSTIAAGTKQRHQVIRMYSKGRESMGVTAAFSCTEYERYLRVLGVPSSAFFGTEHKH